MVRSAPSDRGSDSACAALVLRAQRGDATAFAQLAQRYARAVYAIALAHLRRTSDAEDCAQSSLLAALENIHDCRQPERFDAWLFTIARNRARRALVRRKLRDVLAKAPDEPVDRAQTHSDLARRELLLHAIEKLTATQREVLLLHDLEGYSHSEIAASLGLSDEASRQHLSRARAAVRAQIEERST